MARRGVERVRGVTAEQHEATRPQRAFETSTRNWSGVPPLVAKPPWAFARATIES